MYIARVADHLSVEVIPNEDGKPSIIWIQDSAEHKGHRPTLMLDPSDVQPVLNKLANIAGVTRREVCRELPEKAPRMGHSLGVEIVHSPPPTHMGINVAPDKLPLVLIHYGSSGSESPPNVVTLRVDDIEPFCDALEKAYQDFRGWESISLYNEGTLRMQRGQYQEAISILKEAILVNPQHNLAVFNLAMCYDLLGQIDDAWLWYQRAMDLDPSDPDPVYNLAEISLRKNQLAQAEAYCRQALSLFQKRFESTQYMPFEIPGEPLSRDELLADIAHRTAVAHYLMACIQANEKKIPAALQSVQQAVSIYPGNAKWWLLMSQLHTSLGNQADAQEALIRAMELDSDIARNVFGHGGR
jgi:Flp pilus assembly protein TadD